MCTLTWFVDEHGYELFFNRDERLSRGRADPPTYQEQDEVAYLSPTDLDAGGTWIAVNQLGVTVCLLNHYQFEQIATYKDWTSRGEIVRQFATVDSPQAAAQQFLNLDLNDYRAFRMFIIEPSGRNRLCVWDGHAPRVERNVRTPKSSSSVDAMHVKGLRKQLFADLRLAESRDAAEYIKYHCSHQPSKSQESVCMHRDDAKTVSLSHVKVTRRQVEFSYADGSPCEAPLEPPISLPLAESAVVSKAAAINF